MPQMMVQIRVDKDLKDQVADIYDAIGIDIPTAIRMFFKRSIAVGGLPFECRIQPERTTTRLLSERLEEKRRSFPRQSRIVSNGKAAFDAVRAEAAKRDREWTLDEINAEITDCRNDKKSKAMGDV